MAWDLPTNFTNDSTVDGVGSMFEYATYATNGMFGLGVVFIIFVMTFGVSALMNIGRAFASASFVSLIFSVYLVRINALNATYPFILAVMTIAGFFWAKSEKSNY